MWLGVAPTIICNSTLPQFHFTMKLQQPAWILSGITHDSMTGFCWWWDHQQDELLLFPTEDKIVGILLFCLSNKDVSVWCLWKEATGLAAAATPNSHLQSFGTKSQLTDNSFQYICVTCDLRCLNVPESQQREGWVPLMRGKRRRCRGEKLAVIHLGFLRTRPSSCGALRCLAFCCFLLHEEKSKEHFHFPPRRLLCW